MTTAETTRLREKLTKAGMPEGADLCDELEKMSRLIGAVADHLAAEEPAAVNDIAALRCASEMCAIYSMDL